MKGNVMKNYIKDAMHEGNIQGLKTALELAKLHREESHDIDYLIETLTQLIEQKETEEIE
jgi:hypothetical protein